MSGRYILAFMFSVACASDNMQTYIFLEHYNILNSCASVGVILVSEHTVQVFINGMYNIRRHTYRAYIFVLKYCKMF